MLRCAERDVTSNTEKSSKYYSAYIWIMFSIETMDGKPFFPQQWKNLLVYFEHGNIAEATTFQTLKESLATKACSSIAEILSKLDRDRVGLDTPARWTIRFAVRKAGWCSPRRREFRKARMRAGRRPVWSRSWPT